VKEGRSEGRKARWQEKSGRVRGGGGQEKGGEMGKGEGEGKRIEEAKSGGGQAAEERSIQS
jgi:hypothetical protein